MSGLQDLFLTAHCKLTAAVAAKSVGLAGLREESLLRLPCHSPGEIVCATTTQVCQLVEDGGWGLGWENERMKNRGNYIGNKEMGKLWGKWGIEEKGNRRLEE